MLRALILSLLLLPASWARAAPSKMIVVLDAGHGGTAHGAVGATGVLEKRVALRAALKLRAALQHLGAKVVMTRTTDTYLTLSERVRRANAAGGHLFVSLHCNASANHQQWGFEAFVLSPGGVARQARPQARQKVTVAAALRTSQPHRLALAATLEDLTQRGHRRRAVAFGRAVIQHLSQSLGAARSRGLRQARFDVLSGLRMPGLLLEMGFLDHPVEGKQVITRRYLHRVVFAVTRAVEKYGKRHRLFRPRVAPKAIRSPGAAPAHPRRRRKDRRRRDPTLRKQPLRKPEVALSAQAA